MQITLEVLQGSLTLTQLEIGGAGQVALDAERTVREGESVSFCL